MVFHQMIKERRKQLGMTQEELAKELNVSRSAISNWEIGRNYPDITTLIELAQMYQVSLDELFYDDIDLVNKFAEDNKKKEQLKKVNKLLVFLLLIGVSSIIYLFLTRKPEIVFAHESVANHFPMTNFKEEEVKRVEVKKDKLYLTVDHPQNIAYYIESNKDELQVNLYQSKQSKIDERISIEGRIEIDLSSHNLTKIRKIVIYSDKS